MRHVATQHQGAFLVEGKATYVFELPGGREVKGQDLQQHRDWPWCHSPQVPGVRYARLRATSPTYGEVGGGGRYEQLVLGETPNIAFEPPWGTRPYLTPITLGTLGPAQVEVIATTVAGGKALPADILAQIVEKTDGVPLFVEEMTKAILESGVLRDTGARYELTRLMETVTIPMTLHDALMARLDQQATAKNLAQLGAVIGRQFSYELIKALSGDDEGRWQRELTQLVNAALLYPRGRPPYTTYRFKPALIQDVAYESLLRRRRQARHGAIAQAIETCAAEQRGEQVGLLASHYSRSAY
jgi:predicted ATPase